MKALYDYDAAQPTELSVKEDEILHVYDKDEDWLLVSSTSEEGKIGYVPGNYVEEVRPMSCSPFRPMNWYARRRRMGLPPQRQQQRLLLQLHYRRSSYRIR